MKKPKKAKDEDETQMMRKQVAKREMLYTVDLTRIEGDGTFPCPRCGTVISPEDETEDTYTIVDTIVHNDELVELTITCNKCDAAIKVTGFQQPVEGLTE